MTHVTLYGTWTHVYSLLGAVMPEFVAIRAHGVLVLTLIALGPVGGST